MRGFCKGCDYEGELQKATEPGYKCPSCGGRRVVDENTPPDPVYAELTRLRAIEAAAWAVMDAFDWDGPTTDGNRALREAVGRLELLTSNLG